MGVKDILKQPLVQICHHDYEQQVKKRQIRLLEYAKRFQQMETEENNKITDDIVLLASASGRVQEGAKSVFAQFFAHHPEAVLAYCDEAWDKEEDAFPWFKPDWSPDTFSDHFYFGSLVAVRRSKLEALSLMQTWSEGLKEEAQTVRMTAEELYAFCEEVIQAGGGFAKHCSGQEMVLHVPQLLFWRQEQQEASVLWENMPCKRESVEGTVTSSVSIVIPSKDHPKLVENCIRSIQRTVQTAEIEILVIDNGSNEKNRKKLEELAETLSFTYLYEPMDFHFSKMCNLGAARANKEHVLFLNDDVEAIYPGWLEEMVAVARREHVGAVGSKLLYPDGKRIQHAGVTNLPVGPVHKLQFLPDDVTYYDSYNRGARNVLAVTGACLLMRRELFLECSGMSEDLAVAFNDVELCFRLYEKGFYSVVLQDKPLYHHESVSRGQDESTEKWQRLMREREILYRLHPALEGKDPFYNIHLNKRGLDSRILPEYRMGQQKKETGSPVLMEQKNMDRAVEDACLLLRPEICQSKEGKIELYGYGVILGSDNALFSKGLLLRKLDEKQKVYYALVQGQYRPDLEQNMQDQKNVAMSGFWIEIEEKMLPAGTYEIGMYASDRTSRLKLYCFSSRQIEVRKCEK